MGAKPFTNTTLVGAFEASNSGNLVSVTPDSEYKDSTTNDVALVPTNDFVNSGIYSKNK